MRRVPHETDRRCKLLAMTDEGKRQHAASIDVIQPLVEQIESIYTPEEQHTLYDLLQRLNHVLG